MGKRYEVRPEYADFDTPHKFMAIQGIIATRLRQHPNAVCSYSGGSDSDILIDLIESTRKMMPRLPQVRYIFFDTGLEMKATKEHVKETAEKYGVTIETIRPKTGIVTAVREHGIPFMSKLFSEEIGRWQRSDIPLSVADEYVEAEDKPAKYRELSERYPNSRSILCFICGCTNEGKPLTNQHTLNSAKYLKDFMEECPPDFTVSSKCCKYCKKHPAKIAEKGCDMTITGERMAEGGARANSFNLIKNEGGTPCFFQETSGLYKFRPLYFVTDKDKAWYKEEYGIRYSDAYEVYGLTRTGCCGCSISYKAVEDLELIRPYEPNLVKAAWNVFGDSYRYRQKYVEYRKKRTAEDKRKAEEEAMGFTEDQYMWF